MSLTNRLRHRVAIEAMTVMRDEIGGVREIWATLHASLPADIVPASGREFMAASATQSKVTTRITIRYVPGIRSSMRLRHGTDVYTVEAVLPDPSLRGHLTLMCSIGPQVDPPGQAELTQQWTIFTTAVDQSVNRELP